MLSQQDIQGFRNQGYTDAEIQQATNEVAQEQKSPLQQSYARAKTMQQHPLSNSSQTMFGGRMVDDNLIKWQLELDSILERVEHMLRGDKPTFDKHGNLIFKQSEKDTDKVLNEQGVAEIMRILALYLNRNTILSNYDEETINWKVLDLGKDISDLIFLKYETLGLDTREKRKLYPIIVREITDTVHSAYLRALHGGERESLREARSVQQMEQIAGGGSGLTINNSPQQRGTRGLLNPMRWLKGKYV